MNLDQQLREMAREEARQEIASLAGLVLRRAQGMTDEALGYALASVFGEALADFSGHTKGGEPGE